MGRICWGSDGYGELLALRWCNVHFADSELIVEASWTAGQLTSPKSRKWRTVPLADQPAAALAGLAARERFAGPHDLVFCGAVGDYLDPSALRRRYRAAGLRPLRFHDLRHLLAALLSRVRPGRRQGLHGSRQDHDDRTLPPRALTPDRRRADDKGLRGRRDRHRGPRMTCRRMTPYGGA